MPGRLAGKIAVVTGGAQGIGRGCVEMMAREGAAVVIGDRDVSHGRAIEAAVVAAGGTATFHAADVTDERECAALVSRAIETFGALHVLVNNVGWFPRATIEDTTAELWDQVIAVNLRSAFFCCKHAIPHLRNCGGGSIINMGSVNGIQAIPSLVAYSAAKGGLLALTRTLAGALARDQIRVNYLIPGWVLTDTEVAIHRERGLAEDELRLRGETLPLGRHQTVEDVAYAAIYLASDESSQVTGTTLSVDAGVSTLPLGSASAYGGGDPA